MKKITFLLTTILFSAILFTGCFDAIYSNIESDVPPESATVSGVITNVARYTANGQEFLLLGADKGLRYKLSSDTTHGNWQVYESLPFALHYYAYYGDGHTGQQIIKVLTDSEYVYIVSVSYKEDEDNGTSVPDQYYIWAKKLTATDEKLDEYTGDDETKGWKNVIDGVKTASGKDLLLTYSYTNDYQYTLFNIFGTNSVINEHRVVYIRSGELDDNDEKVYGYYKLNGQTAPQTVTISDSSILDKDRKNADGVINSCQYCNGTLYFFNAQATATNATDTIIYYANDDMVSYYDGENHLAVLDAQDVVTCFAVTSDALLIGRGTFASTYVSTGGMVKTSLTNGVPANALVKFTTNASSQFPTTYLILTLLAVDPTKSETDAILYTSLGFKSTSSTTSASYTSLGLWSYYPERGNWNRE